MISEDWRNRIKVYICGSWNSRNELRPIKERLSEAGYQVLSAWIESPSPGFPQDSVYQDAEARRDLGEIDQADWVIVDTRIPTSSGGTDVEFGYVLGKGFVPITLVGPKRNVFHSQITDVYENWDAFMKEYVDPLDDTDTQLGKD